MAEDDAAAPTPPRVVVRYRLPADEVTPGGPRLSDAVGEVIENAGDAVVIRTRRGDVRIPLAAIVHAKSVPPRP